MRRIPCSCSIYYAASRFPSKYVLRMGVTLDGDGDAIRRILAASFSHGDTGGVMERGIVIGVGNLGCAAIRNLPDDPQMFRAFIAIHHTDYIRALRSEEHTSELQSLMRISYAVFCL